MNSFLTKWLLGGLVFVLAVLLAQAWQLNKRVNELESAIIIPPTSSDEMTGEKTSPRVIAPVASVINGQVKEKSHSLLIIMAKVPATADLSSPMPPPMIEKKYTVRTNSQTKFGYVLSSDPITVHLLTFDEVNVGDFTSAVAPGDIGQKDEFVAKEITVFRSEE